MQDCSFFPPSQGQKGRIREQVFLCSTDKFSRGFFCKSAFYHRHEITDGNLTPLVHPFGDKIYRTQCQSSFKETSPIADGRAKKEGRRAEPMSANEVDEDKATKTNYVHHEEPAGCDKKSHLGHRCAA